jgi:hypothetical protein
LDEVGFDDVFDSAFIFTEIADAIQNIRGWGSVEIQIQDFKIIQITERNIRKTQQKVEKN